MPHCQLFMGHVLLLFLAAHMPNYVHILLQAYLAYGVPENDIKLFSLMQKVCLMEHLFGYSHVYWTTYH